MRQSRVLAALCLVGLLAGPMIACSGDDKRESTGEYIDDSVISNKVRAKLIDDKDLNVFQIDVTTYRGIVQLSGFVSSAEAKARATRVASSVEGVKQVANNLIVK
jgi:hyperosmotically inducible protein